MRAFAVMVLTLLITPPVAHAISPPAIEFQFELHGCNGEPEHICFCPPAIDYFRELKVIEFVQACISIRVPS